MSLSIAEERGQEQVSMSGLLSQARKVQLLVQIFNKINCWFVEGLKVIFLVSAILLGYVGIRLRQNNLLITVFCPFVHIGCIVAYCGTFNRAYRLQEFQKKLKRELKAACKKFSPRVAFVAKKGTYEAAVTALSCPGLKVGRFHDMERESVLIFIDFLEKQVISLLVAF